MLLMGFELSQNFEYMLTIPGFLKVLTLIFGVITISLGGSAYENEMPAWKEVVFIAAVIVCLAISFLYLAAHCFSDQLVVNKKNKLADLIFHVIASIFYIVSGSLMIDSAVDIEENECQSIHLYVYCEFFATKLGGGIFGILTGLTYALTAVAVSLVKNL